MKKEMDRDEFTELAKRVYPIITELQELARDAGAEGADLRADTDGYFVFHAVGVDGWEFCQVPGYEPEISHSTPVVFKPKETKEANA